MKFNLLGHPEKLTRDVSIRFKNKKENSELALKFDKEYFDGKREHGYGGYNYDGRWVNVAKSLIKIEQNWLKNIKTNYQQVTNIESYNQLNINPEPNDTQSYNQLDIDSVVKQIDKDTSQ